MILWLALNFLFPVVAPLVSLLERHTHTTTEIQIFDTYICCIIIYGRTLQDRRTAGKLRLGLILLEDGKEIYGLTKVLFGKGCMGLDISFESTFGHERYQLVVLEEG